MAMNPETNRMELISKMKDPGPNGMKQFLKDYPKLFLPNGEPVPTNWKVFKVGEIYEVNGYNFKCVYFNETTVILEPTGPILINGG